MSDWIPNLVQVGLSLFLVGTLALADDDQLSERETKFCSSVDWLDWVGVSHCDVTEDVLVGLLDVGESRGSRVINELFVYCCRRW